MFTNIRADIEENLPSLQRRRWWRTLAHCCASPSVRALFLIRLQAWCFRHRLPTAPAAWLLANYFAIEISKRAEIGPGLHLPVPWGIVIAPHVSLGARCHLGAEVHIVMGPRFKQGPILGDDVFVGDGARIVGRTVIGDGAIIGISSVVMMDVPPGAAVMGNPARIVEEAGQQISMAA